MKPFLELGYSAEGNTILDEYRGIEITFLQKDGYEVELVSPVRKDSVAYGLMKKYGNAPYHICYETQDMDTEIGHLRDNGYVLWEEPHAAVAFENKRVCFLIHPYMGMIELKEV